MTDLALTSLMLFGSTISCRFWSFWWALNMIIISNLGTYRCISLFRIYNHLILDYTFFSLSSYYYYSLRILNCVIQKQYNLIEKNIINQATEFVVNDKNIMFQLQLYQIEMIQNYLNSWNLDSNAQLPGTNIS